MREGSGQMTADLLTEQAAELLISGLIYVVEPDGAISPLSVEDYCALPTGFASKLVGQPQSLGG